MSDERLNRRQFLAASSALAVVPGVLAQTGCRSANDRITAGVIGTGDQGTNHLRQLLDNPRVEVRAVCDVYKPNLRRAARLSKADSYGDYRELLARDDIDCVWIASPDHWHAQMGIDALEAGKDVYCEKPMARYWHEARDFYRTAERTQRVVQIGAQSNSHAKYRAALEIVRQGGLGPLVLSQTSFMRNSRRGDWNYPIDYRSASTELDWEGFLGPAPPRPFDPVRYFRWRKFWDYSGGVSTDFLSHPVHPLAMATGSEWPVRVVASGGILLHPDREVPDTFHTLIDFESGHTLMASAAQTTSKGLPVVIRGHHGWLEVGRDTLLLWPDPVYTEEIAQRELRVELVGDNLIAHHENFLDCVLSRNRRTNCPPELGYKVAIALDLANRSWREQRVMRFDPARQELIA